MSLAVLGTIAVVATVISVVSSVAGGIAAQSAAEEEAKSIERQGDLSRQEAEIEAQRTQRERDKFLKKQKLAFLKSGVTLEGSPLFVFEETRKESAKEVEAIRRQGGARFTLGQERAEITRARGRAALIGGISSGASTIGSAASVFSS